MLTIDDQRETTDAFDLTGYFNQLFSKHFLKSFKNIMIYLLENTKNNTTTIEY